jgi:hypothetical protein
MNASTVEETPIAISQFVLSTFCVVTVVSLRTSAGTSQELLQITLVDVSPTENDLGVELEALSYLSHTV